VLKLGSLLALPEIKQMLPPSRDTHLASVVDQAGFEDVRREMVSRARANGWDSSRAVDCLSWAEPIALPDLRDNVPINPGHVPGRATGPTG